MNMKKLLLILILSLFALLCDGNNITFYENESNLKPNDIISYSDNTLVFRLVKKLNETCYEPRLIFRILYSNNTSNLITVLNHNISSYSFCSTDINRGPEKIFIVETIPNYIFLIYGNFTDLFGMVIDLNGNIKSNTLLGNINNIDGPYENNVEDQYEYVFFESILDSPNISIKKFIIMSGKVEPIKIQDDVIQMPNGYKSVNVYPTIDQNFLFIFVYTSAISQNTSSLSLEPKLRIYGSILQKDANQLSDLFLIYQTAIIVHIDLAMMNCVQFYDGSGFYCIMKFTNSAGSTLVKVIFLSNGKITETEKETNFDDNNFDYFTMNILKSGVLILAAFKYDVYGCNITGYFLGPNNQWVNSNSNPKGYVDYPCSVQILRNSTVIFVPEKKEKYWILSTLDIPNVMNDKGYQNPIINWTKPAINETILLETTQIQIAYNIPIKCSSKNMYIYQKLDDKKDILRETYSAQSNNCQVLLDNTTLLLTILPSTFNQPSSLYYIKIDPDFVKQNRTLEPLFGIPENMWMFTTESHEYMIDDSVSGFLRLTDQGTLHFENLSSKEKANFIQNLTGQLADIIPIPSYRIKSDNRYQLDTKGTSLHQILINIQILKSNSVSELNVSFIVKYLDTLVKNNENTLISTSNLTSMLDNTYGFQTYMTFINIITIPVIVMATILFILIICYLWAQRRYKEGKNLTIIIIAFMLYDFITDLLFLFDLKNRNLLSIFLLSLIFTIPPILFNLFAAIYIISKENAKNPKFYEYFIKNTTTVSVCSVIAGADIEVLHILSSNFANLNIFSAEFSEKAEDYMFWCALIGFLFEDIPQFCIQIAYRVSRVEYTTIPALTLISSTLMLLINIIGRLHSVIIRCRNSTHNNESTINLIKRHLNL